MKPKANRATGSLDMRQDLVDGVVRLQLKDLLTKANESDDSTLLVKLSQCLNPSTSQLAEYMKILSQISTSLKKYCDCTDVTCEGSITVYISVLAEIHSAVTRNPVRRMISSTLQNLPQRCHSVVIQQFSSCLQRYMSKTSGADPDHRRHVIDLIASYLENWPLGECVLAAINKPVLAYLSVSVATLVRACCEAESPTALTNLTQSCHVILKNTIAVLQKCFHGNRSAGTDSLHRNAVVGLINAVFEILSNSIFTTNCQSVAGMTLIAALKLMSDSENMVSMIMKTLLPHCCPGHLPSVNKPIQDVNEELSNFRIHWNQLSTYCQLCVCHGILAMLDIDSLVSEVLPHTTLLDLMFTEIMKLQKSLVDSYSILAASRTLTLWTHTAKQALQLSMQNNLRSSLSGQGSVSKHILDYVWENWEHAIEGMRYQMKIIFENVIEMHILATGKEHRISNDSFILDLFHQLMTNSWHIRSKYSFLVTMVTYIGSARVLELHPTTPQDVLSAMEEQTTAPYASDLYEKLLQSHKEQMKQMISESSCHGDDTWQQVWLPPVLEVLNSRKLGSTLLVQYLLPRLLKNNPESLDYIIGSLHTSSNESHLSAMITCLKVARSQGLLAQRPCDNSETWHGVIHVSLLKQAVCHKDNQISIQALSLICDSSKSTEVFSSVDFHLIKLFLKCNTKNQSAASRHCINSNVKKILSRIQEGGLVLWKQRHKEEAKVQLTLYKEFVEWLYNFAFSNLYCDACYPRRATALSILTLLQDAFTTKAKKEGVEFSFWSQWTSVHVQSILECLTDSYVGNREMARKLLVNVPTIPDKVKLYKDDKSAP
ncbi:tRNA (32-2'-O)-methyltransferase regulator THADA-like [Ptychodera flava]|uniref:tRNA (32-2'-O)-methyltransferase regulator THADA-like n=1 Tax=Ptychodera flava TaxID=63121 RepID=UPI00396A6BC3